MNVYLDTVSKQKKVLSVLDFYMVIIVQKGFLLCCYRDTVYLSYIF